MKKKVLVPVFIICLAFVLVLTLMLNSANLMATKADSGDRDNNPIIMWSTEDPGAYILRTFPITGGGYIAQQCNSNWGNMRLVKYNSNNNYVWDIPMGTVSNICPLSDGSFWAAGSDGSWGSQIGYIEKYTNLGVKITGSKISFADFAVETSGGSFNITNTSVAVVDDGLVVCGLFNGTYELTLGGGTQIIERTGTNLNSVIFKIGFDGRLLMAKDLSCSPNSIRVTSCQKLANGNIAFCGYTNNYSSNVPGLACISGYDEFILVLDGKALAQNICTIDWVKTINVSGNHYGLDNMRISGNTVFLYGSSDASNGIANASTQAVLGTGATWGANSSILIAFNGDNKGEVLFIESQAIESYTVACTGTVIDNNGNYIVLYTVSKSDWTYSKIVRYDEAIQIISEIEIGEPGDISTAYDIARAGKSIIIVGNANYRFDTGVNSVGSFDAFIYSFNIFPVEITIAPTVENITYNYGDLMPALQGGTATVEGTFSWASGQTLATGTHVYTWIFTPNNSFVDVIVGKISITVLKAIKETPTAEMIIKLITSTSIEFYPIAGAEYSLDSGLTWQDSILFENLAPATEYTATYRLKGDDNYEQSLAAAFFLVKTLPAVNNGFENIWQWLLGAAIIAGVIVGVIIFKAKKKHLNMR